MFSALFFFSFFAIVSYFVMDEKLHLCSFLMFEFIACIRKISITGFNDMNTLTVLTHCQLLSKPVELSYIYFCIYEYTVFLCSQLKLNIIIKILLI